MVMDARDISAYVIAHSDQVNSILKEQPATPPIQALVDAIAGMRTLLIEDNGVSQEVADAMLLGTVATLIACMQLEPA